MEQDSPPQGGNISGLDQSGELLAINETNIIMNVTDALINVTSEILSSEEEASFYQRFLGIHFEGMDYYQMQDKVLSMMLFPFSYVYNEFSLNAKIVMIICIIFIIGVLIPLVSASYKWIKAVCHPIMFPYKHVLITGCGSGLGKALVQEIFMKGAYITMVGRDQEKLKKLALSVDVSINGY